MKRLCLITMLLCLPVSAFASEGGSGMEPVYINVNNRAALQRGAKLFINYCLGCHSLKYQRYIRLAEDLGLDPERVEQSLMYTGDQIYDLMTNAMAPEQAEKWFGIAPPDLTLTARSRGGTWIYNYLQSFYLDPSRPMGWNNTVLENAAMPNPLWMLQGIQIPVYETVVNELGRKEKHLVDLKFIRDGRLTEEQFERVVRDITTFLVYVGEPAKLVRKSMGIWVMLFIAFFTLMAWLLKREYWRDVH